MVQAAEQIEQESRVRTIEITVNRKPVTVRGHKHTGLEIKEAAIAQGVRIELDFQLSVETGPHKTEHVNDTEVVTVHKGSAFVAVAGDDNS